MPANAPYPHETTAQFKERVGKKPKRDKKRNPFLMLKEGLAPTGPYLRKNKGVRTK